MRIATWNINGVRARIETALAYLRDSAPDVVCFQEIKCQDEAFPEAAFADLGYVGAVHGQKGFNGVAILSKHALETVQKGLPGDEADAQARFLMADIAHTKGVVRVVSLYLPNGNPVGTEKYTYKLAWMERLQRHVAHLLKDEMPLVLAGDYNVIPEPQDAKRPEAWAGDALFQPASRAAYRSLLALGLTDALRACQPAPGVFTFWDYQAGAWARNDGIRIDHLLLSPESADRLRGAGVDSFTRGWDKPSDHVPAWVDLADA